MTTEDISRLEVLPAAACADCGQEFPHLHRHHIVPRAEGGGDDDSNIAVLCPNCHHLRHGGSFGRNVQRRPRGANLAKVQGRKIAFKYAHETYISQIADGKGQSFEEALSGLLDDAIWGSEVLTVDERQTLARYEAMLAELRSLIEPVGALLGMTTKPQTVPVAARVLKTIGFPLTEWAAIEALMLATGTRQFTALVRVALASLAKEHGVPYPTDADAAAEKAS